MGSQSSKEQGGALRRRIGGSASLRDVVTRFLRTRPAGASLAEIYAAVERDRPATSHDAVRGELNHGVVDGRYVRIGVAVYELTDDTVGH